MHCVFSFCFSPYILLECLNSQIHVVASLIKLLQCNALPLIDMFIAVIQNYTCQYLKFPSDEGCRLSEGSVQMKSNKTMWLRHDTELKHLKLK